MRQPYINLLTETSKNSLKNISIFNPKIIHFFFRIINFDKSTMMNSNLSFGTFPESSFFRVNLYESVNIGANFEKANFTSANLTRADFMGATLIEANFQNANAMEANFTNANITSANFEGANLSGAKWMNGKTCGAESIGVCKQ